MYIIDDYDLTDFYPDEYVGEISDETIKDEYNRRFGCNTCLNAVTVEILLETFKNASKMQLHDILADIAELQHTATNEEIFKVLNDKM